MRRCSDEPQRSASFHLPHAVRDLHAGAHPGRLLRRLHARGLSLVPDRWLSLRWFHAIARYPEFISAFWRSLWLGALSSAIAVAISVPAALAIARHRFRGRDALAALFMSPLMIPHVVLGIAFLRFFTEIGLGGTFVGLVLAHIVIVLPFALRLTLASAVGLDRAIEHAAISLGASDWTVFRRVTLPLVLPGLVSGWALAFINRSTR